jgi:TatA/E family protein of Tat protein translocase
LLVPQSGQYDEAMNLGFSEMAFLFVLALLLFGPKKLPEIGRQIGKALNEFKRASNEFRSQIEAEINNMERETASTPQILPPNKAPEGAVASGTLIDLPAVEHIPTPVTPSSESIAKAPDA